MMNKKRTKEIGRTKYLMFLPLAALLMIVSNIETVARTSEIWMPTLTAIEELPLSIINPEQKGETTFHVTIIDKQGKVVPNVKIQTTLAGKQLNFKTGGDGKTDITLDMNGLKHATMYATSQTGNNFIFVLSQGETTRTINMDEHQYTPPTLAPDANGIFEVVEHMPEFPDGGMSALMEYLKKNIKYPEAAMKKGTQGRVTVQFVVEKDGSIANAKVLRGVDPDLDKEAVRVVSVMPKWKPGTQKGEAVRVKYTVPVMFRLTEDNTQVKYAPIENKIDEMVVVGYAPEETTYPEEVTVFEVVEKMPGYPGGMSAMMAFISKNIKYPVAAQKAKIQGRVVIQFIVDKEGNIICPRVIRGADPLLDAEAIRLTTIMPKWKPGMQRGQAVNVKYTVPIMFRLQEPEKNPAVQNATVTPTK